MNKKSSDESAKSKSTDAAPAAEETAIVGKLPVWFPDLDEAKAVGLSKYLSEILKFNKTINLISQSSIKNAESVHIADSVLASRLISKSIVPDQPLYDFGSGNGLPGLVFALLYPSVKVILIDRDQRKMEFCKHTASLLGLKNVLVEIKAVEDLPAGSVKNVMGRGFAPLQKALLVARKQVGKGGRFFHLKGDGWANELASLPSQFFTHWSPSLLGQYRLPETSVDMAVVLTEKSED